MERTPNTARRIAFLFTVVMAVCLIATGVYGDDFPRPAGAVNDFAGVISPRYEQSMESLASEVLEKTGTAVVVVTMKEIGGMIPLITQTVCMKRGVSEQKAKTRGF